MFKYDIRTGVDGLLRDESGGFSRFWPDGVRRIGGMSVVLAFISNSGTSRVVVLVGIHREREYVEAKSRRREYRMSRTGADWGVLAMKPL